MQAIHRMVMSQGRPSELGRACYEMGPVRSQAAIAAFLQQAMNRGQLRQADPGIAALQLKGLLEAEWIEPFLFNALGEPSPPGNPRNGGTGDGDVHDRLWAGTVPGRLPRLKYRGPLQAVAAVLLRAATRANTWPIMPLASSSSPKNTVPTPSLRSIDDSSSLCMHSTTSMSGFKVRAVLAI